MAEMRRDPILRRWVIIAPEREAELRGPALPGLDEEPPCPFCPGNEALNPIEIAATRVGSAWTVRVTPDRRPLLRIEGDLGQHGVGMFDMMNPIGAHELVVDTPHHARGWADFTPAEMVDLLAMYRDRSIDLRRDSRFRDVVVLKNHGAAWSRYSHAHSHVVATSFTPKRLEEEIAGARAFFRMRERCVFCDQVVEESAASVRIVAQSARFVVFAPFASEHPFELRVLPRRHSADFGGVTADDLVDLAPLLIDAMGRLRTALNDPAYSLVLHSAALDGADDEEFHWHWEIIPRLGREIGMEWATGIYSNPVAPEHAASMLRDARPTPA